MSLLFLLVIIFSCNLGTSTGSYEVGDCGIKYTPFIAAIAGGIEVEPNEFPWHVAVYKMSERGQYEYQCGGSIIGSNIVVTAAHCVFDENKQDIDYKRTVVIAGKINGSWEHRDIHEQRLEVIRKKVPQTYQGSANRFQEDIALLSLNDSITFTDRVMPVCVDWNGLHHPNNGELVTMVGWGFNENNILSEMLTAADMETLNLVECRNRVKESYTSSLTLDKFCAEYIYAGLPRKGDSGGGLVFSKSLGTKEEPKERHFIYGIFSGFQPDTNLSIFTNISNHIPWINRTKMNLIDEANLRKVCGVKKIVNHTELDGNIDSYTHYPWLATIYMIKEKKFFGIRCVGSIIHQRAIITSYWCIWDGRPHYKEVKFRIRIGIQEINMKEDTEELTIVKTHIHQNFIDWNARVENDLVILIVDKEIKFTKSVAPICIDWDRKFSLTDPVGMIVSWDIDECHCQVMAMYKYRDIEDCSLAFGDSEEHQTYLTSEKVCGKYVNGTRFLYGSDVGAGYFFLKNGTTKHYLQGVVSKGQPTHKDFLIFTNIELNLRWISDILSTVYNSGS